MLFVLPNLVTLASIFCGFNAVCVVAQDNPHEPSLLPDASQHDLARPLAELLEQFVTHRAATVAFLSGLDQRDWGRPLVHAAIGPTRLRDQVQELVTHDNAHLEQIVRLREWLEP